MPTIIPRMTMWVGFPEHRRLLLGRECLVLQGYPVDRISDRSLQAFGDHFLADLAGNAFPGTCVAALLIVSTVRAPWTTPAAPGLHSLERRVSDEATELLDRMIGSLSNSAGDSDADADA
jgi:hypothetical protein